ncbi:ATP-binding protein [Streptomyces ehimensis]|uniref:ATP-binding protein n=1 Tax=Streptomyces ehimensis TaxID=68195 RepID=A0ABV9BCR5_9ACTN
MTVNIADRHAAPTAVTVVERPRLPVRHQIAIEVAPHEQDVGRARHKLRETLISWGTEDGENLRSAELVASELLTNAIRYAPREEMALTAAEGAGSLLIEVEDGGNPSSAPTIQQGVAADAVSGRGMLIVDAMADEWSWRPLPNGGRGTWAVLPWPGGVAR